MNYLNTPTELCEIMNRYGSDKGNGWHNYTKYYHNIFKDLKNNNLRIFELGLGTNNIDVLSNMGINGKPGASLYGWEEYFSKSDIYGADIDKRILFNNNRIKTYYCDQTSPDIIKNMWTNIDLTENFDIIIEDGLHTFDANVCFFENSLHKLKQGGYYIIEDICYKDFELFNDKIKEWTNKYPQFIFTLLLIPNISNNHDNNLLVIKYK